MKRIALVLATLLLASGATGVQAGTGATHSLGGSAGLAMPMGDLADAVGTGFFIGASYNYRFNAQWAAGVDLDYFSFGEQSTSETLFFGTRTEKLSAHGGQSQFYAKYFIPMADARIEPYLKAGYFHYRIGLESEVSYRGSTTSETDKELDPGFGVGLGATRRLNDQSSVGLEIVYSQIQTSGDASNFWQIGLNYYFKVGK